MMTVTTLLLALGVAWGIYMLRKRFLQNSRNNEQEVQVRQLEQRLVRIAQQGTEEVSLAVLQLEEKLEQANAAIEELRYRTQLAEGLLWQREQETASGERAVQYEREASREEYSPSEKIVSSDTDAAELEAAMPFAQKLAIAAYQLSQTSGPEAGEVPNATLTDVDDNVSMDRDAPVHALSTDKTARYEQAASLLLAGKSELEAARELDLGIGEVRLAKQLLQKKGA